MDCSVTKRKGCNYCLRRKNITSKTSYDDITINDEEKVLYVDFEFDDIIKTVEIEINYCPICGKEL